MKCIRLGGFEILQHRSFDLEHMFLLTYSFGSSASKDISGIRNEYCLNSFRFHNDWQSTNLCERFHTFLIGDRKSLLLQNGRHSHFQYASPRICYRLFLFLHSFDGILVKTVIKHRRDEAGPMVLLYKQIEVNRWNVNARPIRHFIFKQRSPAGNLRIVRLVLPLHSSRIVHLANTKQGQPGLQSSLPLWTPKP